MVTINRPGKRYALSAALKRVLTDAARTLAGRTGIVALVLTGAGGAFTAGNEFSESKSFAQDLPLAEAWRMSREWLEAHPRQAGEAH